MLSDASYSHLFPCCSHVMCRSPTPFSRARVASLDIPTTVPRVERHPIPLPASKRPMSHQNQFQRRLRNLRRQHHPQHHSWSHLKQIHPLQVVQRRLLPRRLLSQPLTVNPGSKVSFQVEGSSTTRGCVKGCC